MWREPPDLEVPMQFVLDLWLTYATS
jgi:hypothetical protein